MWTDMMVGVGGCVPCFYDDTIFQFHLSENNICLVIMLSAGSHCKTYQYLGIQDNSLPTMAYLWSETHSVKVTNIDRNI